MAATTHLLTPPAPLRAFGVAAGLAVAGLVVFLLPDLIAWPGWLRILGVVVLGLSVVMAVLALRVVRTGGVTVELDERELRVKDQAIEWSQVQKVTRGPGRISLYRKDGSRIALVVPTGGGANLDALGADIARYLDQHRGYGRPA